MSLYQSKKSPYWQYDFVIQGRRFHGSTGTTSKTDANKIEERHRREAALGIEQAKRMSLDIALGRYWQEHGRHQVSSEDLWEKMCTVKECYGASRLLSDFSNDFISGIIAKRRGEVSDASVNRETTVLRAVMNRARDVWEVPFNMPNWDAHFLIEPLPRTRFLSDDEEKRLIDALRPDLRPLVKFCLLTGARISSARGLTWDRVQDDRIVLRKKSRFKNDELSLPLVPELRALIEPERGRHPIYVFTYLCQPQVGKSAGALKKRKPGERYPFSRDGWRRTWASALTKAKITDFRFHDTRHTAGTQMLAATGDIMAVKEALGHRDIKSTLRYAHVQDAAKRRALSRNSPEPAAGEKEKPELSIVKSTG